MRKKLERIANNSGISEILKKFYYIMKDVENLSHYHPQMKLIVDMAKMPIFRSGITPTSSELKYFKKIEPTLLKTVKSYKFIRDDFFDDKYNKKNEKTFIKYKKELIKNITKYFTKKNIQIIYDYWDDLLDNNKKVTILLKKEFKNLKPPKGVTFKYLKIINTGNKPGILFSVKGKGKDWVINDTNLIFSIYWKDPEEFEISYYDDEYPPTLSLKINLDRSMRLGWWVSGSISQINTKLQKNLDTTINSYKEYNKDKVEIPGYGSVSTKKFQELKKELKKKKMVVLKYPQREGDLLHTLLTKKRENASRANKDLEKLFEHSPLYISVEVFD